MSDDQWYSDAAIAKMAELDRKKAAGEPIGILDLAGILEPRVKPTGAERCYCCGGDGRDEMGGMEHGGKRWCSVCVGREHHERDDFEDCR